MNDLQSFFSWLTQGRRVTVKHAQHDQSTHGHGGSSREIKISGRTFTIQKQNIDPVNTSVHLMYGSHPVAKLPDVPDDQLRQYISKRAAQYVKKAEGLDKQNWSKAVGEGERIDGVELGKRLSQEAAGRRKKA